MDVCAVDPGNAKDARKVTAENLALSLPKHCVDASAKHWKSRVAAMNMQLFSFAAVQKSFEGSVLATWVPNEEVTNTTG